MVDADEDKKIPEEELEVDMEPSDELGDLGALQVKLKKVREELVESKQKRDEYLDGWQRCKADTVNARRDASESVQRSGAYARENLIEEIIPALDGFDMAMRSETWQSVDQSWRSGVEGIKMHMERVLQNNGVEIFGDDGETFDANMHEAIEEKEGGETNTVATVLRRGYRTKDRVLRPAQVVIFK